MIRRAVAIVDGKLTEFEVSDWGYTSEGVAGLQILVDAWYNSTQIPRTNLPRFPVQLYPDSPYNAAQMVFRSPCQST